MSSSLAETLKLEIFQSQKELQLVNSSTNFEPQQAVTETKSTKSPLAKAFDNSRSSDSGKSSSCSPILLDCSFDSGIAGVLLDSNEMQLHKRIQQCQCILLALERDREYFFTIRNRLSKITNRKKKQSNENEFFCNVCCSEIDPEDDKTFVKCYICQKYICRSIKCADWLPKTAEWECELCQTSKESLAQTSSWVADQISFHQEKLIHPPRARSEIYIPISECNDSSIHFESVSQIGANSAMITAEQKLKIREYVEEVVAKLLGGNLDTIAVNQLSKSENYLPDPKNDLSHNGISGECVRARASNNDFTDISETRLRQMIQKIIAETISLPPLSKSHHAVSEIALDRRSKASDNRPLTNGYHPRHRTEHYFEPTIYQDLLATAVLNKIVDKQLNNNHEVTESDTGGGVRDGEGEEVNDNMRLAESDQNFNIEKLSTTSGSSVEPQSDCSYPEMEQLLNTNDDKSSELIRNSDRDSVMSDYLASHMIPLPDLNAMATESEEEDYMSVTSSAIGDGTWEKNWLFKKKKSGLTSSVTTNSVGMLVPDPKEDVRAQIGDKTADEVSDLSELGSDTDDSLDSLRSKIEPINDRLANKHLIGGQNNKMVLDELIERSSMISNTLQSNQDILDACNEHVIDAPTTNEAINDNVTQQECTLEQKGSNLRGALCSVVLEDQNSNSLAASDDTTESDGCIGFSAIEIIEPTPDTPSVVEILAAMALGPMLAVPSADQPATLTVSDFNVFTDLKELALAEIKARSLELTPRNLDVIPEETGDVINQTDNVIESKNISTLDETESSESKAPIETIQNSSELSTSISELNQQVPPSTESIICSIDKPETESFSSDKTTNENMSHSSTLKSTKFVSDNSHLTINEKTDIEQSHTEESLLAEKSDGMNDQISTESEICPKNITCSTKHEILSTDVESNDNTNAEMHINNDTLSECLQSNNDATQQSEVIQTQESSVMQLQDDLDTTNQEENSNRTISIDETSQTEEDVQKVKSPDIEPNVENIIEEVALNESIDKAIPNNQPSKIQSEQNNIVPEEQSSVGNSKTCSSCLEPKESSKERDETISQDPIEQSKVIQKQESSDKQLQDDLGSTNQEENSNRTISIGETYQTEEDVPKEKSADIEPKVENIAEETPLSESIDKAIPNDQTSKIQSDIVSEEQSSEANSKTCSSCLEPKECSKERDETISQESIEQSKVIQKQESSDKQLQDDLDSTNQEENSNHTISIDETSQTEEDVPKEKSADIEPKVENIAEETALSELIDKAIPNDQTSKIQSDQNDRVPEEQPSEANETISQEAIEESKIIKKQESSDMQLKDDLESTNREENSNHTISIEETSQTEEDVPKEKSADIERKVENIAEETALNESIDKAIPNDQTSKIQSDQNDIVPEEQSSDGNSKSCSSCLEPKESLKGRDETISQESIEESKVNQTQESADIEAKVENKSKEIGLNQSIDEATPNDQTTKTQSDQNDIVPEEQPSEDNSKICSSCLDPKETSKERDETISQEVIEESKVIQKQESSDMQLKDDLDSTNQEENSNRTISIDETSQTEEDAPKENSVDIEPKVENIAEETALNESIDKAIPNDQTSKIQCDQNDIVPEEQSSDGNSKTCSSCLEPNESLKGRDETIFQESIEESKVIQKQESADIETKVEIITKEIALNESVDKAIPNDQTSKTQSDQNDIVSEEQSSEGNSKTCSSGLEPKQNSKERNETISSELSETQTEHNKMVSEAQSSEIQLKAESKTEDNILDPVEKNSMEQSSNTHADQSVNVFEESNLQTKQNVNFLEAQSAGVPESEIINKQESASQNSETAPKCADIKEEESTSETHILNDDLKLLDETISKPQSSETQDEKNESLSDSTEFIGNLKAFDDPALEQNPKTSEEQPSNIGQESSVKIKTENNITSNLELLSKTISQEQSKENETVSDEQLSTESNLQSKPQDNISNEILKADDITTSKEQSVKIQTEQNEMPSKEPLSDIPRESKLDSQNSEAESECTESIENLEGLDETISKDKSSKAHVKIHAEQKVMPSKEPSSDIPMENESDLPNSDAEPECTESKDLEGLGETISKEKASEALMEEIIKTECNSHSPNNETESEVSKTKVETDETDNNMSINSEVISKTISQEQSEGNESVSDEQLPIESNLQSKPEDSVSNENLKAPDTTTSTEQSVKIHTEENLTPSKEPSSDIPRESKSDSPNTDADSECTESIENSEELNETISEEKSSMAHMEEIIKTECNSHMEEIIKTECNSHSPNNETEFEVAETKIELENDDNILNDNKQSTETQMEQNIISAEDSNSDSQNKEPKSECTNSNENSKVPHETISQEQFSKSQIELNETILEDQLSTESNSKTEIGGNITNENSKGFIETISKEQCFEIKDEFNTEESNENSKVLNEAISKEKPSELLNEENKTTDIPPMSDTAVNKVESETDDNISNENQETLNKVISKEPCPEIHTEIKSLDIAVESNSDSNKSQVLPTCTEPDETIPQEQLSETKTEQNDLVSKKQLSDETISKEQTQQDITTSKEQSSNIPSESISDSPRGETISQEQSLEAHIDRNEPVSEEQLSSESNLQSKTEDNVLNENVETLDERISKEQSSKTQTEPSAISSAKQSCDISPVNNSNLDSISSEISNENSNIPDEITCHELSSKTQTEQNKTLLEQQLSTESNLKSNTDDNISNKNLEASAEEQFSEAQAEQNITVDIKNNSNSSNNEMESKADENISNDNSKPNIEVILTEQSSETQAEQNIISLEEKLPSSSGAESACIESQTEVNASNKDLNVPNEITSQEQFSTAQTEQKETVLEQQLSTETENASNGNSKADDKTDEDLSCKTQIEQNLALSEEQSSDIPIEINTESNKEFSKAEAACEVTGIEVESKIDDCLSKENSKESNETNFHEQSSLAKDTVSEEELSTEAIVQFKIEAQTVENTITDISLESNGAAPVVTEIKLEPNTDENSKPLNKILTEQSETQAKEIVISLEEKSEIVQERNSTVSESTETVVEAKTDNKLLTENLNTLDCSGEQSPETQAERNESVLEEKYTEFNLQSETEDDVSNENVKDIDESISKDQTPETQTLPSAISSEEQSSAIPLEINSNSQNEENTKASEEIIAEVVSSEEQALENTTTNIILESNSDSTNNKDVSNVVEIEMESNTNDNISEPLNEIILTEQSSKNRTEQISISSVDDDNLEALDETISQEQCSDKQTELSETVLKEQLSIESKTDNVSYENLKVLGDIISEERTSTTTEQNTISSEEKLISPNSEAPLIENLKALDEAISEANTVENTTTDIPPECNSGSPNNEVTENKEESKSEENILYDNSKPLIEIILTESSETSVEKSNLPNIEAPPANADLKTLDEAISEEKTSQVIPEEMTSETETVENTRNNIPPESNSDSPNNDVSSDGNSEPLHVEILTKSSEIQIEPKVMSLEKSDIVLESNSDNDILKALNETISPEQSSETKDEESVTNEDLKSIDQTICKEQIPETKTEQIAVSSEKRPSDIPLENNSDTPNSGAPSESTELKEESVTNEGLKSIDESICKEQIPETKTEQIAVSSEERPSDIPLENNSDTPNSEAPFESTELKEESVTNEDLKSIDETICKEQIPETKTEQIAVSSEERPSDIPLENNSDTPNSGAPSESTELKVENNSNSAYNELFLEEKSSDIELGCNSDSTKSEAITVCAELNIESKTDNETISQEQSFETKAEQAEIVSAKQLCAETNVPKTNLLTETMQNLTSSTEQLTEKSIAELDSSLGSSNIEAVSPCIESKFDSKTKENLSIESLEVTEEETVSKEQLPTESNLKINNVDNLSIENSKTLVQTIAKVVTSETLTEQTVTVLKEKSSDITPEISSDFPNTEAVSACLEPKIEYKTEDNISHEYSEVLIETISQKQPSESQIEQNYTITEKELSTEYKTNDQQTSKENSPEIQTWTETIESNSECAKCELDYSKSDMECNMETSSDEPNEPVKDTISNVCSIANNETIEKTSETPIEQNDTSLDEESKTEANTNECSLEPKEKYSKEQDEQNEKSSEKHSYDKTLDDNFELTNTKLLIECPESITEECDKTNSELEEEQNQTISAEQTSEISTKSNELCASSESNVQSKSNETKSLQNEIVLEELSPSPRLENNLESSNNESLSVCTEFNTDSKTVDNVSNENTTVIDDTTCKEKTSEIQTDQSTTVSTKQSSEIPMEESYKESKTEDNELRILEKDNTLNELMTDKISELTLEERNEIVLKEKPLDIPLGEYSQSDIESTVEYPNSIALAEVTANVECLQGEIVLKEQPDLSQQKLEDLPHVDFESKTEISNEAILSEPSSELPQSSGTPLNLESKIEDNDSDKQKASDETISPNLSTESQIKQTEIDLAKYEIAQEEIMDIMSENIISNKIIITSKQSPEIPLEESSDVTIGEATSINNNVLPEISNDSDASTAKNKIVLVEDVPTKESPEIGVDNSDCGKINILPVSSETNLETKIDEIIPKGLSSENENVLEKQPSEIPVKDNLVCTSAEVSFVCLEINEQSKVEDIISNENSEILNNNNSKDLIDFPEKSSETQDSSNSHNKALCSCFESKSQSKAEDKIVQENSDQNNDLIRCLGRVLCPCLESNKQSKTYEDVLICQQKVDGTIYVEKSELNMDSKTEDSAFNEYSKELDDANSEEHQFKTETQQNEVILKQQSSEIPLEVISNSSDINALSTCLEPKTEDNSCVLAVEKDFLNNDALSPNLEVKITDNSAETVGNIEVKSDEKTSSDNNALFTNTKVKTADNIPDNHSLIISKTVVEKEHSVEIQIPNEQPKIMETLSSNESALSPSSEAKTKDNSAEDHSLTVNETVPKEHSDEIQLQNNEIVSKEETLECISNSSNIDIEHSTEHKTEENILDEHSKACDKINSIEVEPTQNIILSTDQNSEIIPESISDTDMLKQVDISPVPTILPEPENNSNIASEYTNFLQTPDVHEKPSESAESLDDSPSISRQSTVVQIEDDEIVDEDNNNAADLLASATNQPPGNHNISKKLQRQYRVEDTTPSFEDVSPQPMPQTTPPSPSNTLAGLCQKYIHDKHLLNALENRRRRTLLMHRFLSTLDLSNSTDDSMEETNKVHTEVLVTENPVVCESFNVSHDHDSDYEDCSDSFIFEINEIDKISYNFINNILFSDQLSHDSKPYADSRTNTIEEYIDNENDEKDILALNFNNNSTTNTNITTTTTITTTPPTNSSTEISSKANTTNNRNTTNKTNNHKQPVTNMSGDPATITSNQKHPYDLLTSAVQNKETPNSNLQCVQQFPNNDQVKIEILTDDNGHNGIHVGVYSDGDHDDGASKDEEEDDDDVAILRHFVPGSIAEREYKKWYNAVEMPNNPYAPEALKRRISGSQERFIDLPNISPTNDLNPLELLNNQKLDEDENSTRESDYKRYSRDYYINSSLTTPQISPARDVSARATKDIREPTKKTLSSTETELDLYKAIPAQVVDNNSSSTDSMPLLSAEMETNVTTTSDDSDTIKMYDFETQQETKTTTVKDTAAVASREQATVEEANSKERPSSLAFGRSESGGNVITPTRGATPLAFKFLQPKRKLLEPSQMLSVEEDEQQIVSSPSEKPVIEAEVAKAMPSVKALARAFLMTTNTTQPEKLWLRKARTLSQGGKKRSYSPKRSLDHLMRTEQLKPEDDLTITSDLSSLETDSSSVGVEIATSSDLTSSTNDPSLPSDTSNISPVPVRQGVLKNNIAFFENLKNK